MWVLIQIIVFFLLSKFGKTKGTEMLVAPPKKKKKHCTQLSIVWLLGLERLDFKCFETKSKTNFKILSKICNSILCA